MPIMAVLAILQEDSKMNSLLIKVFIQYFCFPGQIYFVRVFAPQFYSQCIRCLTDLLPVFLSMFTLNQLDLNSELKSLSIVSFLCYFNSDDIYPLHSFTLCVI